MKTMRCTMLLAAMGAALQLQAAPAEGESGAPRTTASAALATAGKNIGAAEKQFLDAMPTLLAATTYDEVKRLVPGLGPLAKESPEGEGMETTCTARLFGADMLVEFNFEKGRLISYMMMAGGFEKEKAKKLCTEIRTHLQSKCGEGTQSEGVSDDARQARTWIASWKLKETELTLLAVSENKAWRITLGGQPLP